MRATIDPAAHVVQAHTIFRHVLVGVDGTPQSLDALRQAALLKAPGGSISCLAAWDLAPPLLTPMTVVPSQEVADREARSLAEDTVRNAQAFIPTAETIVSRGDAGHALIEAALTEDATLVAVGSHGRRRAEGILVGSTASRLLHEAPCSVLLARETTHSTPRRIAVGVDGSPESAAAYRVAQYLAGRFDGTVVVVIAEGKQLIDLAAISLVVGDGFDVIPEEPVRALVAASADADLLVLGNRGLHGFRSLGSVSERVAHRAECTTLVVRHPQEH